MNMMQSVLGLFRSRVLQGNDDAEKDPSNFSREVNAKDSSCDG